MYRKLYEILKVLTHSMLFRFMKCLKRKKPNSLTTTENKPNYLRTHIRSKKPMIIYCYFDYNNIIKIFSL